MLDQDLGLRVHIEFRLACNVSNASAVPAPAPIEVHVDYQRVTQLSVGRGERTGRFHRLAARREVQRLHASRPPHAKNSFEFNQLRWLGGVARFYTPVHRFLHPLVASAHFTALSPAYAVLVINICMKGMTQ